MDGWVQKELGKRVKTELDEGGSVGEGQWGGRRERQDGEGGHRHNTVAGYCRTRKDMVGKGTT